MKTLIALAGSLLVAGSASAAFTGVYAVDMGNPASDQQTYRFYAGFDNPDDGIQAFSGLEGQPLLFTSFAGGIINDDATGTGHEKDLPYTFNGEFDTWLTIGATSGYSGFPSFTPEFLGTTYSDPDNLIQVLVDGLTSFYHEDSAVFIAGPAVPVDSWGDHTAVALAQFTVPLAEGVDIMEFGGVLTWEDDGTPTNTEFYVLVPSPGALALLGLAGLIGRRRR